MGNKTSTFFTDQMKKLDFIKKETVILFRDRNQEFSIKLVSKFDDSIFKPQYITFDDVIGLDDAKTALEDAVIFPNELPEFLVDTKRQWKTILLYGPKGTGKFLIATALAAETRNTKIIKFSFADFFTDILYRPGTTIKFLFEYAKKNKPSVILIKDIELIYTRQFSENIRKRLISSLLEQLKLLKTKNFGVTVLATSSLPKLLIKDIKSHFQKRIFISLPDENERYLIIKNEVNSKFNNLNDEQISKLNEKTSFFSGKDINVLVKDAMRYPLRRAKSNTHFKKVTGPLPDNPKIIVQDLFTPCESTDPKAVEMDWRQIDENRLQPVITMDDVQKSLLNSKPTTDQNVLKEFIEISKKF